MIFIYYSFNVFCFEGSKLIYCIQETEKRDGCVKTIIHSKPKRISSQFALPVLTCDLKTAISFNLLKR